MTTPIFTGTVDKGQLKLDHPHKYLIQVSALNGKKVELVLRKRRTKRSDRQNRYYWGVVIQILANFCGYEPEEMHESLKYQFLRDPANEKYGLPKIGSTADLSTDEFNQYVNRVVRWAATNLQVFIPDASQIEIQ
jgi:hypothetical protein